ncbi:MAG TPA: hypothetical protein DCW31_03885 [Lactobacillus sp.]|nr:hypothetical protein [Lactobacillus sp.]
MVKGFKRRVNWRTIHAVDNHRAERPLLMSQGEGRRGSHDEKEAFVHQQQSMFVDQGYPSVPLQL